jgi:hypothetical protein
LLSHRCESTSIVAEKSSSHNARHHRHNHAIALMSHLTFPRSWFPSAIQPRTALFPRALSTH